MIYPGDKKNLICSITNAAGTSPNVTVVPIVSVVNLTTQAIVLSAITMSLIAGTQAVYYYSWSTNGQPVGDYLAIVSYAADSITINGRFLEIFHLGDTNITGVVALNSTVALNATVAKDATVAHVTDLTGINPNTSSVILAIKASTDNLPQDPASNTIVNQVGSTVDNIYNYTFGTWVINKQLNPQVLTILAPNGTTVATFQLTDSSISTIRQLESIQ
jgi:hypothetical protein